MTLTLRSDHLAAVVVGAVLLTAAALGAAMVLIRDRRAPALLIIPGAVLAAGWATVTLAAATHHPLQEACRDSSAALRYRLISLVSVGEGDAVQHPAVLVLAAVVTVGGVVLAAVARRRRYRRLAGAFVLVGIGLGWLCVDSNFEGPAILKLARNTGGCREVLPHGLVAGDLVALVPLAAAGWLGLYALKPWRWGHSSAPVVAQS